MQKILMLALALSVAACGRNMDSTTYTSSSPVAKVVYGTVISARQVTVKDTERMQDNALGGLAGGVTGGVAGSAIGGGTGRSLATVGGVILGAVAGAAIQDELGTSTGTEYIVQLDSPKATGTKTIRSKERLEINRGSSVSDDINDAIQMADTQSEAIAVVQKDEVVIAPGTRVAVIYADDRPRIAPLR